MMKTTTETSIYTRILSWSIALVGGYGLMYLLQLPSPDKTVAYNLNKDPKTGKKEVNQEVKEKQQQAVLPPQYTKELVNKAEKAIVKDLEDKLKKFQEMSAKMRKRKDGLLDKVESRRLPASAPANSNNTSMARNIPRAGQPPLGTNPSAEEVYEMLRQYETEIQKNHIAISAAKEALGNGLSFPDVYNSMSETGSEMESFDKLIDRQTNGKKWNRIKGSKANSGLEIKNTADLNNYRGLLDQASREAGLAGSRLESLFGTPQPNSGNKPSQGSNSSQGDGKGNGGMAINFSNSTKSNAPLKEYTERLNKDMIKAQALPGRRFSKTAKRKGWLYINTWYMIGPWEDYGRDDFAIKHPPEISIDLDAVYRDGQKEIGTVETDSDPLQIIGKKVRLDGTLRWKFMQSESLHNTVPVTTNHSTYYAYTELYFDEATVMLVAMGTDDSGRVWINGKDVWQDKGTSWYYIDESIVRFQFRQGWNKVLVRLENSGGGPTGFSMLICPKGAVNKSMLD